MLRIKSVRILLISTFIVFFTPFASAQNDQQEITLGFDGLQEFSLDLGEFGVTFQGAAVLTCGQSLNCGAFPPFSGANVLFDNFGSGGVITAEFDTETTGTITFVSARITGNTTITMTAFDSSGNVLDQASTSGANYAGSGGEPNELVQVETQSGSIALVEMKDNGNTFTVDDFTFDGVSQKRVVIDAGHGRNPDDTFDRDPVPPTDIIEDLLTLDISRAVEDELSLDYRFLVKQTRTGEATVPIDRRRQIAEAFEADAFVSIHTNASGNAKVNGAEMLVNETKSVVEKSRKLAGAIQPELTNSLGLRDRGVKESPDLPYILKLGVLKSNLVPSTLAEIGFHSNTELDTANGQTLTDNEQLASSNFRRRAGRSVAEGIIVYFNELEQEEN